MIKLGFSLASLAFLFFPLSGFSMTWEELGKIDSKQIQDTTLKELTPLSLGSRILGHTLSSPFYVPEQPTAELILGGILNVTQYRALSESPRLLADLDRLKSVALGNEELITQLKAISNQLAFKTLIPPSLQEALHNRAQAVSGDRSDPTDQKALNQWILAVELTIGHYREEALQLGYPLAQPLLIVNVAKEYAPTGAISLTDLPVQMLRSEEDLLFLLKRPAPRTRVIFAPWVDSSRFDLSKDLPTLSQAISTAHQYGFVVYIHCKHGVSRSAALTLDYLLHYASSRLNPSEEPSVNATATDFDLFQTSLHALQTLREQVQPNPGFIETLKKRMSK
jgi:hypothetical protein